MPFHIFIILEHGDGYVTFNINKISSWLMTSGMVDSKKYDVLLS